MELVGTKVPSHSHTKQETDRLASRAVRPTSLPSPGGGQSPPPFALSERGKPIPGPSTRSLSGFPASPSGCFAFPSAALRGRPEPCAKLPSAGMGFPRSGSGGEGLAPLFLRSAVGSLKPWRVCPQKFTSLVEQSCRLGRQDGFAERFTAFSGCRSPWGASCLS